MVDNTFYQKVLREIQQSNSNSILLCHLSETFRYHWTEIDEDFLTIRKHARQFLDHNKIKHIKVKIVFLFSSLMTKEENKKIRIDFIKWAIRNIK